ncbi:MAG: tripartite tricarboxylate transporter substrate binding protein, partial [Candidatus Binatia bacterium]
GIDVDDSSVNFRGIMAPKGTPVSVIKLLAERVPQMFRDKKVIKKMQAGGSPMRVIERDQVLKMWQEREQYLKGLLAKLKKK